MMSKQCSSCGGDCGHEKTGHCMYGIIHESDCARHNMPSMPKADCNCYLSKLTGAEFDAVRAIVAKWDYATEAAIEAYLLGRDTERFFKCGDQNDDGKREPRKLPPPSIQCARAFTEWFCMPIDADMDIQTQVAWENWQIAWNASLDAAASEQAEQSDRSTNEIMAVLRQADDERILSFSAKEMRTALNLWATEKHLRETLQSRAAQPAQAQAVPEGWQLVPVVPTRDMLHCIVYEKYPEDWKTGKILQDKQHKEDTPSPERVPFKTEFEIAAGKYQRVLAAAPALPTAPADTSADEAMSDTPAMPELLIKSLKNTIVIVRRHFGLPDVSPNGGGDLLYALNASAAPALTTDSADALKKRNSEQEPVGWLYGNSYWSRDNQRITDHIKEHGRALYDRPAHQGVQAISAQSTQTDELSDEDMPELPYTTYNGYSDGSEPLYTQEQMRDYARSLLSSRKGKDAEDARRYRFLRNEAYEAVIPHGGTLDGKRTAWITKLHPGDTFDAAIDSAIEQGKDGGV